MKNQGFTLIELVISITIILVIGAVAVPGVVNYQAYQNEEQFINQVVNNLRIYQNISLTKDKSTYFSYASSSISFCEDTECMTLTSSNPIFQGNSNLNKNFRFNEFGDIFLNTNKIDLVSIESPNFILNLSRFGGISKNKNAN